MMTEQAGTRIDQVIGYLRDYVADRGLTPGSTLPSEASISAELGVSRPIVREAMRSLATSGLITVATGKRAVVSCPDGSRLSQVIDNAILVGQAEARDILEMRRGLEVTMAGLAAQRRTREQVAELRRIAAAMEQALGAAHEYARLDLRLHRTLAEAADNPLYPILIEAFHQAFERSMLEGIEKCLSTPELRRVQQHHEAIIEAVDARDASRASAAMGRHFDEAIMRLVRKINAPSKDNKLQHVES